MEEKMQRERNRNRVSNNEDGESSTDTTSTEDTTQTGETDTLQTEIISTVSGYSHLFDVFIFVKRVKNFNFFTLKYFKIRMN